MTPPVPRIDVSSLCLGAELGSGGQGKVTEVTGLLVTGQPAVLKTYSAEAATRLDADALETIVGFPRQLDAADSTWLQETTAWPSVLVENGGTLAGFLMRAVPPSCYFGFRTQTRGTVRKLADMAFLLNPDPYLTRSGLQVTDRDRLGLLASLARDLGRLHGLGVTAGDLSPKNLLFSLTPAGCLFIDCDAMQVAGRTVLPQIQTPDWEVPAGEPSATPPADTYKLALLAVRLFARDQSARDPAALAAVSAELGRLAEMSLYGDPSRRPAPGDWARPLQDAAAAAATPAAAAAAPARRISVPIPTVSAMPVPTAPVPSAPVPPRARGTASGPRRRRRRRAAGITGLAAALVIAAVAALAAHLAAQPAAPAAAAGAAAQDSPGATGGQSRGTDTAGQDGLQRSATAPASASPPAGTGLVSIGSAASGDSRSAAVTQMLTTYFSAINQHHYQQALSVFAPGGKVNPSAPGFRQNFARGLATTNDSQIVLEELLPAGGDPATQAVVSFRSQQAAGYGPQGDLDETCTVWNMTYALDQAASGAYQITQVASAAHSGC